MTDPYEILGLRYGASPQQIRRAYKRMARRYHPDLNPHLSDAEEKFKDVAYAYDRLKSANFDIPPRPKHRFVYPQSRRPSPPPRDEHEANRYGYHRAYANVYADSGDFIKQAHVRGILSSFGGTIMGGAISGFMAAASDSASRGVTLALIVALVSIVGGYFGKTLSLKFAYFCDRWSKTAGSVIDLALLARILLPHLGGFLAVAGCFALLTDLNIINRTTIGSAIGASAGAYIVGRLGDPEDRIVSLVIAVLCGPTTAMFVSMLIVATAFDRLSTAAFFGHDAVDIPELLSTTVAAGAFGALIASLIAIYGEGPTRDGGA